MSRFVPLRHSTPVLIVIAATLISTACGGGGQPQVIVAPPPNYNLTAGSLSSSSVAAGSAPTSTLTITPVNGYTGTVSLTCTVTGNSTPAPSCNIVPSSVSVTSTVSAAPVLTVTTRPTNPSAAYSITVTGKDGNGNGPANGAQSLTLNINFQHIIIIVQENRTPDNLFQDPKLYLAPPNGEGADIAQQGTNSSGDTIILQPTPLGIDYDLSHQHDAFTEMCDYQTSTGACKMDGADQITITCSKGATDCPPANPQFLYVDNSSATNYEIQPYWDMAEQYTFGDRMFQTNEGPSFPAHQFLFGGTSVPCYPSSSTCDTTQFVSENPMGVSTSSADAGCTAPSAEYVATITALGVESATGTGIYPCMDHPTLSDELDNAKPPITWRYYAPLAGSIWTAPTAVQHICVPNNAPPNGTECTGSDWLNYVELAPTSTSNPPILQDIAAGNLQAVSWVIPTGSNSDHAGDTTTTGGPSWVSSIVNEIGQSAYWSNTAIIIVWDDWGGWYDHVAPPKIINDGTSWGSGYVYGFRVPLIVVSPVAKAAYISHTVHDFGSILNFVEQNFGVGQLVFADSNTTDNLADCFNLSQAPITFTTINAPLKADFFIHDRRPPTPPDND